MRKLRSVESRRSKKHVLDMNWGGLPPRNSLNSLHDLISESQQTMPMLLG